MVLIYSAFGIQPYVSYIITLTKLSNDRTTHGKLGLERIQCIHSKTRGKWHGKYALEHAT